MPSADMRIILDKKRLQALRLLSVLDTGPDPAFDRLVELAAKILDVPVALVTFIDADRQFFKSQIGMSEPWATLRQVPLSHSFCQHVVAQSQPLIISDARTHPLVYDNLAIVDMNVVAYAGIPIISSDGQAIGSFCAIDHKPRDWTQSEIDILTKLAAAATTEIELRSEIMERLNIEQVAQEQGHFVNQIINHMPGLIYVYHLVEERLIYISLSAQGIFGYPIDELKAMGAEMLRSVIHPDDLHIVREHRLKLMEADSQEAINFEYRICPPGKDHLWLRSSESVFSYNEAGQPVEVIGVSQNITEYKQAEQEREQLLVRITELEQLKSDMIRVAAHDLRAPLTLMTGYAGLLKDEALTTTQHDFLAEISKAAARMDKMIRDILSLDRIEAHAAGQHETVHLDELVQVAFEAFQISAEQKNQTYTLTLPSHPIVIKGDMVQIQEAFENLIGNAIKYTPEGGTVQVRLMDNCVFEVEDTGFGIPEDQQKGLFSPFYRVQRDETRHLEGTGLGLHLVKRIVERHGGRMHFHSRYGEGSIFGFRFES